MSNHSGSSYVAIVCKPENPPLLRVGLCALLILLAFNLMLTDLRQLETKASRRRRILCRVHFLCGVVILKGRCLGKAQDTSLIFYLENRSNDLFQPCKSPNYEMFTQRKFAGPSQRAFLSEAVLPYLFCSGCITLAHWSLSGLC